MFKPGDLPDESLIPSSGPYKLSAWESGNSLTLVANENYYGEAPAGRHRRHPVHLRHARRPRLWRTARSRRWTRSRTPTCNKQLEKLGDSIVFETADQFTWEHYDFNFDGAFEDKALRQAFALCLPRQTIVDNLIKPDNPEADRARLALLPPVPAGLRRGGRSDHPGGVRRRRTSTRRVRSSRMPTQSVPTLRLGYILPNDRRAAEAQLVQDACGPDGAGFDVMDEGDKTFFNADGALVTGNFDVALFAWAGSPLVTGSSVDLRHRRWKQLRQLLQQGGRRA